MAQDGTEKQTEQQKHVSSEERHRRRKKRYAKEFRNTILVLLIAGAVIVLSAVFLIPVYRITGNTMTPTLEEGNIALSVKTGKLKEGDLAAVRYHDKILIRRVIGLPGDEIEIDDSGTVKVNGEVLAEPYVSEPALGQTDVTFPYEVPEGEYFVMGDNRSVSIDSRNTAIGSIPEDMIAGKLVLRIFPLNEIETLS
ncbi:signal peptidase I [Erysipelotrichaceae bacterium Oil+RF-744-GAM-WT-6]|uniref:Signal peptidase I n=1 Tax=Stecheria intestinalis TaxID=2606630 RepID=A0A7X2TFM3_9FIRM|nr:signal peptidase I [Stecheria intestinalis]MSS57903.1 signal peptidase I [Stecheria intestinalis]